MAKILLEEIQKQKMYLRRQAKNLRSDYASEKRKTTLTVFAAKDGHSSRRAELKRDTSPKKWSVVFAQFLALCVRAVGAPKRRCFARWFLKARCILKANFGGYSPKS